MRIIGGGFICGPFDLDEVWGLKIEKEKLKLKFKVLDVVMNIYCYQKGLIFSIRELDSLDEGFLYGVLWKDENGRPQKTWHCESELKLAEDFL